ncbi:hypothetical protein ABS764_02725 [Flavobacterium sp. ST-87]|uniref:Uncharacterized protein n=1 Tax=Flavobacterium plantiphilum TaxID=3163297 RepID=A0ABW8XPE6_9FLAO
MRFPGPYGTIYEPFFAGFEEIGSNYVVFEGSKIVRKVKTYSYLVVLFCSKLSINESKNSKQLIPLKIISTFT